MPKSKPKPHPLRNEYLKMVCTKANNYGFSGRDLIVPVRYQDAFNVLRKEVHYKILANALNPWESWGCVVPRDEELVPSTRLDGLSDRKIL